METQALDTFDLFDAGDASLSAALLTQKSLVDTQERLGAMLEVMPIGLLIHTEQGILFANQEACELLQADKQELVGQHLLDRIANDDATKVAMQMRGSFGGDLRTASQEVLVDRHDGTQRLANGRGRFDRVCRFRLVERRTGVAPSTPGEGFGLVAEVPEDGVVAASAPLGPSHQFQKHRPSVLDPGGVGRLAFVR